MVLVEVALLEYVVPSACIHEWRRWRGGAGAAATVAALGLQ